MTKTEVLREFYEKVVLPNNNDMLGRNCTHGALTGSLGLYVRGVTFDREIGDIDIAVDPDSVHDNEEELYIPSKYVKSCENVDLGGDYHVLGRVIVEYKGHIFKVEILPDEEVLANCNLPKDVDYYVSHPQLILAHKLKYVIEGTDKGGKHRKDLLTLLNNRKDEDDDTNNATL